MKGNRTLGKSGSRLLSMLSAQNKTVFSLGNAREVFPEKSYSAVKQLLNRLVDSGWLIRLKGGHYLIVPLEAESPDFWTEDSFVLASASVSGTSSMTAKATVIGLETPSRASYFDSRSKAAEYAISYWSALNYYGYTEQIPRTVFISTPKRGASTSQELLNIPYRLIFLSPKKFFGVTTVWINNKPVQITDKEKTIVDCFDRPKFCGGIIEAAKGLSEGIKDGVDLERLTSYADQIGSSAVFKRLGFLAEILKLPIEPWLTEWQKHVSRSYSLLDPTQLKRGRYNAKWHVIVNVEDITTADEKVVG